MTRYSSEPENAAKGKHFLYSGSWIELMTSDTAAGENQYIVESQFHWKLYRELPEMYRFIYESEEFGAVSGWLLFCLDIEASHSAHTYMLCRECEHCVC